MDVSMGKEMNFEYEWKEYEKKPDGSWAHILVTRAQNLFSLRWGPTCLV